MSRQIVNVI